MSSIYTNIRGVFLISPFILHLCFTDVLLSLLLPLSHFLPKLVYDLCSYLASSVWTHIQFLFTACNGADITVSGDTLPPHESAIVIANHVSWTDFYMIQALAMRSGMLGRCRWFAKSQLRWVPFLGWGLWAMGMPLVTREWTHDRAEMERVFGSIKKHRLPVWLISYSEATRYTPEKYQETIAWCLTTGNPLPQHALFPRTKGFISTVQQLKQASHVKAIYDTTIAYAKRSHSSQHYEFLSAPDMWESLSAPALNKKYKLHVHVTRYDIEDIPTAEEELKKWLVEKWFEKGTLLESMRQNIEEGNGSMWRGEVHAMNGKHI